MSVVRPSAAACANARQVRYPHAPQSHGLPLGASPITRRMPSAASPTSRCTLRNTGNDVLRGAARECNAHIRITDLAARYGGDEFVLVLVRTGVEGALGVADKVRTGVEVMGREMRYPDGLVTVSIGVSEYAPGRGPGTEDVLVAADRALYKAKAAGRNQVATGDR